MLKNNPIGSIFLITIKNTLTMLNFLSKLMLGYS
jgi:hypothetical protein